MTNPKRKGILSGITRPTKPVTGGATRAALAAALTKIRLGALVKFEGKSGLVISVNERMITVGSDLGYRFTILAQDLLMKPIEINGQRLQLTVIERKEEEPTMTEFESLDKQFEHEEIDFSVPEGQDWQSALTREKYLELKNAGWSDKRIIAACGTYISAFATWKVANQAMGVRVPSANKKRSDPACDSGGACGDQCRCTGEAPAESAAPEPDEWEWFGAELRARGSKDAFISISGKEIRISSAASVAAGFERGQKVAVGISNGGLALRRSDNGIPLVGRGAPQSSATQMGACSIVELLIARGWTVPCKLEAEWDAKRGTLIGHRNRKAVG